MPAVAESDRRAARFALAARLFVGLFLIAAAILKAHDVIVNTVSSRVWGMTAYWSKLLLIEGEIALGLWVILGVWPRAACLIAGIVFAGFACVNAWHMWVGVTNCGCLGAVQANPKTLFVIDLICCGLTAFGVPRGEVTTPRFAVGMTRQMPTWSVGLSLLAAGIAAKFFYASPPQIFLRR